ncbi:flagellar protein FliS [Balneolaceae bacterium ANBcel3]|nr:flagellar protein FliS [Balneolaceae bacterium ANBcel3]
MRNPQLEYQRQSVMNASPVKLIIKLYDLAIQASYSENEKKLRDILSTLINGLNFDHEPAAQLFNLYRYCQELAREERYEEIREILEPLRDAWEESASQVPMQNGTLS